MIKKVLEIVDVRKLANAIYNNKPDVVKGILEPVPDHLSLYLTYLGIPLHHIAMFVEIAVSEHKGYNSPYDKPYHDNQIIKKLLSQKFVVDLDEEIPFYDYSLKFDLHTMGEQYIREDVFAENNLETLKRFDTNELDMELYIAALSFNFDKARQLLEKGARPDVEVLPDYINLGSGEECIDPGTAIYDIENEIADLPDFFNAAFYNNDMEEPIDNIEENICWLASLAANEKMYALLKPYCRKRNRL